MVVEQTLRLLRKMKLGTMADEYERQMDDRKAVTLSFDDRFGMMVDIESSRRQNNRLAKLVKSAGFTDRNASVEGIIYSPERGLDEVQIQRLASCAYIEKNLNIQLLGVTGAGKSYIANALGVSACRNGYSCCGYPRSVFNDIIGFIISLSSSFIVTPQIPLITKSQYAE